MNKLKNELYLECVCVELYLECVFVCVASIKKCCDDAFWHIMPTNKCSHGKRMVMLQYHIILRVEMVSRAGYGQQHNITNPHLFLIYWIFIIDFFFAVGFLLLTKWSCLCLTSNSICLQHKHGRLIRVLFFR